MSLLNSRHESKTKVFKYQGADSKEKFIRDQTQKSNIYHRSKTYLNQDI